MAPVKPKLMVIDDLDSARAMMKRTLARSYEVYDFASVAEALPAVERADFDCIVTDLRMPGIDGLEGLRRFKAKVPAIPVVLVTAFATVETAVAAMKAGAFDYLKKPFEPEELEILVGRAVEHARLVKENQKLRAELKGGGTIQGIVGKSQAMKDVTSVLSRIAGADVPILIEGESGTGKDLLARAAHAMSGRAAGPYVALNMSAIPENLAEAELFGHEKGAFTGAEQAREGFFAEAEGGTLFLDELGMLPPSLQPKLLRVLQDGEYIPVGSRKARKANVRVIGATNEDLARLVKEGKFREDLWFRLRVVPVRLPPLRERREDIPALIEHFVQKHALRLGRPPLQPDAAALRALLDHTWPGNIRELEHAIERGLLLAQGAAITLADLPPELTPASAGDGAAGGEGRYKREREAWERGWLQALLREVDGSVTRAAEHAGLDRSTVYDKLKRYGLLEKDPEVTPPPVRLRPARDADAAAMARIMRAAALAVADAYPAGLAAAWGALPALYHRWAMTAGGERRVVALAGRRVVGFAGWRGREVTALFVLPALAGRGLGGRLLAAAEAGAAAGGARTLTVVAARSAAGFYRSRGWRDAGPAASPLPDGRALPARRLTRPARPA